MADVPNTTDPQVTPDAAPKSGLSALLANPAAKWVVGGLLVAVIGGLVVFSVITFVLKPGSDSGLSVGTGAVPAKGSGASAGATAGAEFEPIVNPPEKPLESDFTFRNVFAPSVKMPVSTTTSSSTTGSSSGTTDIASLHIPADTLYLASIETVDGVKKATFYWNNESYSLAEGETLAGTPWKVEEIGDDTVVMLYGDTEVTLSTGQGLTK